MFFHIEPENDKYDVVKLARDLTRPRNPQKVAFWKGFIPGYFRKIQVGEILWTIWPETSIWKKGNRPRETGKSRLVKYYEPFGQKHQYEKRETDQGKQEIQVGEILWTIWPETSIWKKGNRPRETGKSRLVKYYEPFGQKHQYEKRETDQGKQENPGWWNIMNHLAKYDGFQKESPFFKLGPPFLASDVLELSLGNVLGKPWIIGASLKTQKTGVNKQGFGCKQSLAPRKDQSKFSVWWFNS